MIDVLFNLASSNSTEELRWGRPEAEDPATSKKSRNEKSQNTADKCHAQTGLQVFLYLDTSCQPADICTA